MEVIGVDQFRHDGLERAPVLLTAEEAAEVLKVAASTVYRLMRSGEMRVVRFGRSVRIRAADLESFIEEHVNY